MAINLHLFARHIPSFLVQLLYTLLSSKLERVVEEGWVCSRQIGGARNRGASFFRCRRGHIGGGNSDGQDEVRVMGETDRAAGVWCRVEVVGRRVLDGR